MASRFQQVPRLAQSVNVIGRNDWRTSSTVADTTSASARRIRSSLPLQDGNGLVAFDGARGRVG